MNRAHPEYLQATALVNSDHPAVQAFTRQHAQGETDVAKAVSLYLAVRDGFRYDPYQLELTPAGMSASSVLERGHGWCVPKAVLLTACYRAADIPARLGFADVRNHMSTARMRSTMKTDLFVWHGYTDVWLEGQWVKATPAFNIELCERFGLLALEFDGRSDSIYHPFDRSGQRHMEYVNHRGVFADLPLEQIREEFRRVYGEQMLQTASWQEASFQADVQQETAV